MIGELKMNLYSDLDMIYCWFAVWFANVLYEECFVNKNTVFLNRFKNVNMYDHKLFNVGIEYAEIFNNISLNMWN